MHSITQLASMIGWRWVSMRRHRQLAVPMAATAHCWRTDDSLSLTPNRLQVAISITHSTHHSSCIFRRAKCLCIIAFWELFTTIRLRAREGENEPSDDDNDDDDNSDDENIHRTALPRMLQVARVHISVISLKTAVASDKRTFSLALLQQTQFFSHFTPETKSDLNQSKPAKLFA